MNLLAATRYTSLAIELAFRKPEWISTCGLPAAAFCALVAVTLASPVLPSEPRYVIAGGMATEVAYAIGADSKIVGVDTTSTHPPEALKQKANVGYLRNLSAEGLLSLNPTRIIATAHIGPPATLAAIRAAGVDLTLLPEARTPDDIVRNILSVGAALDRKEETRALAAEVDKAFLDLASTRAQVTRPIRVLFIFSTQNGKFMTAGRATSADLMIRLAGAVNAVESFEGFKVLAAESIVELAPEFILTMSRTDLSVTADDIFSIPAFKLTPAAANRRFASMNGLYLLGLGPRTPAAARDLFDKFYSGALRLNAK